MKGNHLNAKTRAMNPRSFKAVSLIGIVNASGMRLLCLVCVLSTIFGSVRTQGQGASTPFISYEAESGTLGGGATIVALTSPPTTEFSSPQLEASGHAYVNLSGTGQYVLWTNNTGQAISAVNMRYSIPDAPGGGGISSTIDFYVNGTYRGAISVNSTQTWVYESSTNYNGMTQAPYPGSTPHVFWDEASFFVPGGAIPAGGTFAFQMDAGNNASYYNIDVVDLESPVALAQPTNSLSILDYGAVSNSPSFDSRNAIQNCLNDATAQGKIAWIPPGAYYVLNTETLYLSNNVTVQGAGPWYSKVVCTKSSGHLFECYGASVKDLCADSTGTTATPGIYAVRAYGGSWVIDDVWCRHMTLLWGGGTNDTVQNCRVNNSWGDGMQFNNGGQVSTNVLVYNNFVRGSGDDAISLTSSITNVPPVWNATVMNNTTVASWWANQMAIYGGRNITIASNLFLDCVKKTGMELNAGFGALPPIGVTTENNTLIRCGSYGYAQFQPGIIIEGGGTNLTVANNQITNSMFEGVEIQSFWNLQFLTNTISSPGTTGITIDSGYSGSGNFQGNTVQELNAGQVAFQNNSTSTFAVTLTNNSWQAIILLSQSQPVTASSFQVGNDPTNGNDGSLSTRWGASGPSLPQWWEVDLGTNYNLTSITVDWYSSSSRAYGYQIAVSTDNVNFTNVVDKSGNTTFGNTADGLSVTARYVKITVTNCTVSGGYASFYEAQVYGTVQPSVATNPTNMLFSLSGNVLTLSWPADHLGWSLQEQTNAPGAGLSTNWSKIPGSDSVTSTNITIDPSIGSAFFRLFHQ